MEIKLHFTEVSKKISTTYQKKKKKGLEDMLGLYIKEARKLRVD